MQNDSRLRTEFLDASKKLSESFQKVSRCVSIDSLNFEKYSTYLQKLSDDFFEASKKPVLNVEMCRNFFFNVV